MKENRRILSVDQIWDHMCALAKHSRDLLAWAIADISRDDGIIPEGSIIRDLSRRLSAEGYGSSSLCLKLAIEHIKDFSLKTKTPVSAVKKQELEAVIAAMEMTANTFYSQAIHARNHAFIEFTGFINEYIKICKHNLKLGIDFTACTKHSGGSLQVESYHIDYIAEKFGCIFGPVFQDQKNRDQFMKQMEWT